MESGLYSVVETVAATLPLPLQKQYPRVDVACVVITVVIVIAQG